MIRQGNPHMLWHENVETFPKAELQTMVGGSKLTIAAARSWTGRKYSVESDTLCPGNFEFPASRRRQYCLALREDMECFVLTFC